MFRRLWSGLPKDPDFPSDLKGLGYFINEEDEVRSIENPDNYYKYFLTRNERHNERQRYAFNEALEKEVHSRLEALSLEKVLLPFGSISSSEPHVPIFMSTDLKTKSRVVVVFGETMQDLGMLAHRVIGGPGGVDKGSLVSIVRALQAQKSGPGDDSAPGIILANTSQLVWSAELKRALCQVAAEGAPMPSAVHGGMLITDDKNRVAENRTAKDHVRYIFEKVVPACTRVDAALDIIGLGDGADVVEDYLDWGVTWSRLQGRVRCFAILGGFKAVDELQCESFKAFLREKACAWVTASDPLGTLISGPDGNPHTTTFSRHGCPVYSSGEPCYVECLLIKAHTAVLDWLQAVALTPSGDSAHYRNPSLECTYADEKLPKSLDPDWSQWQDASLDQQPPIDFGEADPRANVSGDEEEEEALQKREVDDGEKDEEE
ncbi:arb2 domain-containing protein [Apiospora kogelbergensis]|uniref:Arb2 domain-containing protein n=1 Tax=Apiospora kogelbergensis TaxID=1337665 RepID=A0AAW0QP02_9PEZI